MKNTEENRQAIKEKIMHYLCDDFPGNTAIFDRERGYQVFNGTDLSMVIEKIEKGIQSAQVKLGEEIEETDTRQEAIRLINQERERQDTKWGEQNHPPHFWTGILGEEYGEYCEAVNETVFYNGEEERKKGGYDNMMTELTHVAAVAVGAMEALMRAKANEEAVTYEKTDL